VVRQVEAPVITFGRDAVERILAAMGEKHISPYFDKDKLAAALVENLGTYYTLLERNSDRRRKNRLRRFKSILAAAERLKKQLQPDDLWRWEEDEGVKYFHGEVENQIWKLNRRIGDLEAEIEEGTEQDWEEAWRKNFTTKGYKAYWKSRSPFEWIAGDFLPKLFTAQFGIEPTFHRRAGDNVPDGPLIRFIEQALIESRITSGGTPYRRETIAKAIADARTGRQRKKRRGNVGQN
jgi:hypothetical protein